MWKWIAAIVFVVWGLTACTAPELSRFQVTDFGQEAPIVLAVGEIDVVSEVESSHTLPHIEKRMPVTPDQALFDWATQRFKAGRPGNTALMIVIREASMMQIKKPSGKWYVLDNVMYELRYQIDVVYQKNGQDMVTQTVSGFGNKAIPQKSALATKEKVWQDLLNDMLAKVNRKVIADLPPGLILSEA